MAEFNKCLINLSAFRKYGGGKKKSDSYLLDIYDLAHKCV